METFPLPVFNIESEEDGEGGDEETVDMSELRKPIKHSHLHKLLSDRSLQSPLYNLNKISKKLEIIAEENLLLKDLQEKNCSLPGNPRSTFLMVFSPDGTKVASSHGDHNIYITDLRTGKCISTLSGHPRTPWCISFHPHRNDILASGCLGGQVRVWDLHGGSEMWSVTASETTTVIASLTFHPSERLLVIATNSTLYFWDWNLPQPFAKCSTINEKQKLRYVHFDPLGNWLITGISNGPTNSTWMGASSSAIPTPHPPTQIPTGIPGIYRMERSDQERERNLQSRYQTLLDQYERLRVRYQELRYRAAELEFNANSTSSGSNTAPSLVPNNLNNSSNAEPFPEPAASNVTGNGSSIASSSDSFWRTLMSAAENLLELSSIGRSLNNPAPGSSGFSGNGGTSSAPSLDHDARMRIQLLSRHIENMQRICRSHLEMTQHRRQIYRLQQIRRILEDLREQIRYLQVCVRDSLNRMSQFRNLPAPPIPVAVPVATTPVVEGTSQTLPSSNLQSIGSGPNFTEPVTENEDSISSSRNITSLQRRRLANYLFGRLQNRQNGSQLYDDNHPRARLYRSLVSDGRSTIRRSTNRRAHHPSPAASITVNTTDPQPGTSRDFTMETDSRVDTESSLDRGFGYYGNASFARWRRSRFPRVSQRTPPPCRNSSLLHMRNSSFIIQRRKSAIFNRIFHNRPLQNPSHSAASSSSASASSISPAETIPSNQELAQQNSDQSLRPLMERLESHFRLQRQAMGTLAQLNEPGTTVNTTDGRDSHSSRPWSSELIQSIRDWRSWRNSLERTRSLEQRSPTSDRFQAPRRVSTSSDLRSNYRPVQQDDDDSSDTDTEMASANTGSTRWRQSSPIRSPRGFEQRMRLLWREYLSQVVEADGIQQNDQGTENDVVANQERSRYRLWLSMMVESLTSFFSQHGINSSEADTQPGGLVSGSGLPPNSNNNSGNNNNSVLQAAEGPSRLLPSPPWRVFPRAVEQVRGVAAQESYGGNRWSLRRNAESQVSLTAHLSITYRIQAWDFTRGLIPDIRDSQSNVVVPESKIHNDASVDVSADGRFLVTLVPCASLLGALISIHSLEPSRLGQCLAQVNVDQFVVSVSISPTCCHLLLGLASSRALSVTSRDTALPTLWARVYKIPPQVIEGRKRNLEQHFTDGKADSHQLLHIRDLGQTTDVGMTSLNCIRWIPTPGQGFVLGTNKGHLKIVH